MDEELTKALSTEAVLAEEAIAIHDQPGDFLKQRAALRSSPPEGFREKLGVGPDDKAECDASAGNQHQLYRALNDLNRTALCLSGGGIRSAAFNLGVIQALATHPRPRTADTQGKDQASNAKTAAPTPAGTAAPSQPETRQKFVERPDQSLLAQFHYLSTVSGGGYIGSWLSAWLHHAKKFEIVWNNLVKRPCGPDVEPGTIAWLRAYSNYLSPKLGLLSADTWAGAAISVRNLLLNWLIILPWICVIVLFVKGIVLFSVGYAHHASLVAEPLWGSPWTWRKGLVLLLCSAIAIAILRFLVRLPWLSAGVWTGIAVVPLVLFAWLGSAWHWPTLLLVLFIVLAVMPLAWALGFTTCHRPSRNPSPKDENGNPAGQGENGNSPAQAEQNLQSADRNIDTPLGVRQRTFILGGLLPALLSAMALTQFLASNLGLLFLNGFVAGDRPAALRNFLHWAQWRTYWQYDERIALIGVAAVLGAVIYAASYGLGSAASLSAGRRAKSRRWEFVAWVLAGVVHGGLVGTGAFLYRLAAADNLWLFNDLLLPLMFGVPFFLVAQMIAEMIFIGLASTDDSEADREWLGRAAGWTLATAVIWFLVPFLTMAGSLLVNDLTHALRTWLAPMGGVAGALTAWAAKSALSPARGEAKGILPVSTSVALAIAAPVFGAALIIFLSAALDKLLLEDSLVISLRYDAMALGQPKWWEAFWWLTIGFVVTLVLALGASRAVNINRFSLHAVYRNRLMRAFLGASRPWRSPDAFTGFDEKDNLRVWRLWPGREDGRAEPPAKDRDWRPFHIINMTLNIVSTRRLAWQHRKAEPFTVSPLHSGSACKAFRASRSYGDRDGISLGTAMAISGAAASPNMGYNSSPGVTFLMALFNVRLGWWLGNPGKEGADTFNRRSPKWAIGPLFDETFGRTTDQNPYIYLSDGGHFENLGLFEMVRRRCRYIVVTDVGADPDYALEDLGNAVRKIELDLGVPIQFHGLSDLKPRPKKNGKKENGGTDATSAGAKEPPYHAIGEVDYCTADGAGEPGLILYIKAGYHGSESAGVRSYAVANEAFPHEGTIDQFFNEPQFESYRALGFEITDRLLSSVPKDAKTLDKVLEALRRQAV